MSGFDQAAVGTVAGEQTASTSCSSSLSLRAAPRTIAIGTNQRGLDIMCAQPGRQIARILAGQQLCSRVRKRGADVRGKCGGLLDQQDVCVAGPIVASAAIGERKLRREMAGEGKRADRKTGAERGFADFELDRRVLARLAGGKTCLHGLGVDHAAQADRELDEFTNMRRAFALVRVEQAHIGFSGNDVAELPGEIGNVANAGAHALAEEGRGLMR